MGDLAASLRALPSVDRVAAQLEAPHSLAVAAAAAAVDDARADARAGRPRAFEDIVAAAREALAARGRGRLQRVLNATGVIVHTNLGRVPLGSRQLAAVAEAAGGYSNLEYDLSTGRRGDRYVHARGPLATCTGAESALVVNNCAAALLLTLTALASGKAVVVARGELIEIGGGFRIPEVLEASGARLIEVGTTNRTRSADYEKAISDEVGALLKVHPSNYRVVGFTQSVELAELVRLGRAHAIPVVYDLGSGMLEPSPAAPWARSEPTVREAIEAGADVVTFSGDKLLGGPQAGVIAGRVDLVEAMAQHPLLRAVRVDKMVLAALEETLDAYIEGVSDELPLWRMALAGTGEVEARARAMSSALRERPALAGLDITVARSAAVTGGGSLPGTEIPSWAVVLSSPGITATEMESKLRLGETPVIGRIEGDRLFLDLRTVSPDDDELLSSLVSAALSSSR